MLALGVVWFFTPALDGTVLSLAGLKAPSSKMSFVDTSSMLFVGVSIAGLVLLALGLFFMGGSSAAKVETAAKAG